MIIINTNIKQVPVAKFIEAVSNGKSYSGIARELGNFSSRGGTQVKHRIAELGLDFSWEHPSKIGDNDYYVVGTNRGSSLRLRVYNDNFMPYVCASCHIEPTWCDKPLTLELDHINGNSSDNRKCNLRWLCPNCHTQTNTYGGRNKSSSRGYLRTNTCQHCNSEFKTKNRSKMYCSTECLAEARKSSVPVSSEELAELLIAGSFTSVGKKFNVSDNTIRKWCKKYGMSTKAIDYKTS